jgi:hypothetical protein
METKHSIDSFPTTNHGRNEEEICVLTYLYRYSKRKGEMEQL